MNRIKKSSFNILNTSKNHISIIHEPEGFEFSLKGNDEVEIQYQSHKGIDLLISDEDNEMSIRIIDDGVPYKVLHKGNDVFEDYFPR